MAMPQSKGDPCHRVLDIGRQVAYNPSMAMKDIFCQDGAVAALQRAVASGKVAGSYIFAGPEGVGKYKTAREWAKVLLCENKAEGRRQKAEGEERSKEQEARSKKEEAEGRSKKEEGAEACGECESCRLFTGQGHPDFHHIYKELSQFTEEGRGKTTPVAFPIDVVREFLIEKVAQTPMVSKRKVFVLSEAEKMLGPAQNALLKALEEPPADCHIILLCTRLDKLLPTTLSRCQVVRFGAVSEEKIIEQLGERGVDAKQARYWARYTGGSLGRAIWWGGLQLGEQNCYGVKRELVSRVAGLELADSVELAQWMSDTGKAIVDAWEDEAGEEKINRSDVGRAVSRGLLYMVATIFSDAMRTVSVQRTADSGQEERSREQGARSKQEEGIVNVDQAEEIAKVAGRFDVERCAELVAEAYKGMNWIEANVNEKLVLEDLLLSIGGCGIV
jgi:DNA polymerase-3 subunit delta'